MPACPGGKTMQAAPDIAIQNPVLALRELAAISQPLNRNHGLTAAGIIPMKSLSEVRFQGILMHDAKIVLESKLFTSKPGRCVADGGIRKAVIPDVAVHSLRTTNPTCRKMSAHSGFFTTVSVRWCTGFP